MKLAWQAHTACADQACPSCVHSHPHSPLPRTAALTSLRLIGALVAKPMNSCQSNPSTVF